MFNKYNRLLTNHTYFQYCFFILLIISVVLNFMFQDDSNVYILYIVSVIFLGIGFYNQPAWFLIFFTALVVACRFFLIPDATATGVTFLFYFFTYFIITIISVWLMKNVQKVREDNIELTKVLANALDSRDSYTLHHSENVAKYAVKIAKKKKLSKNLCNIIHIGALLHDIGKIGIPEHILTKPGKLTNDEYHFIKTHPTIGYEIIKHVASFSENGVLDIVLYHHERFDGKGYPKGLKGKQIPLVARIIAVADTFDAMTSKRVYRDELDLDYTLNEIRKNKGTQFDPDIVDVFLGLFEHEKANIK
ncbi:HD-GYP domain-containing protein [Metabacillus bambusae]|uniref:HD-GYP domain-containing protein n=1 Tax=Metabacillus bambusae TaxID=2795218 RepID=A0ABS3MW50_9BACI|nr:HD-GYP domain-containing protein [Metabacillus bambusae]MBO1510237.1 HD-GYP domain-containing protein [Metabacillus bambusae]